MTGNRTTHHLALLVTVTLWLNVAGCQQYQPSPLDISAHRQAIAGRMINTQPLQAFAERLTEAGVDAPQHFSIDDGMTSAEGEVLALFYNPQLRIARLEARVALARLEHAGTWSDPVFGFDGADILSPSGPFEFGLMLNFSIPLSGRLGVERDRAAAQHEAQLRAVVNQEWKTRSEVRRQWARWAMHIERSKLLARFIEQIESVVDVTTQLEQSGELSRAEARVFTIALAAQRSALARGHADVAAARARLFTLVGLPPNASIDLTPGQTVFEVPDGSTDLESLLIANNTRLATLRAEYQVAEQTLRLEIRKQFPDIDLGAGYGNEDDDRLLLGVSIPLPILNGNRPVIAEARAERDLSRARAETTYETLSSDLAQAMIAYATASGQRVQLQETVLALMNQQLDELGRLAQLGEVDTLLTFESLSSFVEATTTALDLQLQQQIAAIDIIELLGPPSTSEPMPVVAAPSAGDLPNQVDNSIPEQGDRP